MGIFGAIEKIASSKIVDKVEAELTKKQNCEQASGYCKYTKNNLVRIDKKIGDLENETKALIEQIQVNQGVKLSFREKSDFRKIKEKANENLKYLYLVRDFFTALAKNASGLVLKNEEMMLVIKFAPYFDGVPVLNINDEDSDDSLLGAFKEVGQELKETFISSKKDTNHFNFADYLYRYSEKIGKYIVPDINSAIESFNSAMAVQQMADSSVTETPVAVTSAAASGEIECPSCHTKLASNAKFCPECGNKVEVKKTAFCTECGKPINPDSKFCANCGAKISR